MENASVSYSRLQNCCSNRLVVHMCLSYLCFDSYHCCTAYHCEFSVCVFFYFYTFWHFFCHCSVCLFVCLVSWASLPEIKIDDDDDDDDDDRICRRTSSAARLHAQRQSARHCESTTVFALSCFHVRLPVFTQSLRCFDAVGWAAERASAL